jgi:hypothetical protein
MLSEDCRFDTSDNTPVKLVTSKKKRKKKIDMTGTMPPSTLKVYMCRDFVEQTGTNIRLLEEFDSKIFELKLKLIDGNIEAGTPMYDLLKKRMDQLQKQADKLVQVGKGIERDERKAKMAKVSSK